jgi:nicotinamidase-related amidase
MTQAVQPHQPVLLVVDVQVGVMAKKWDVPRMLGRVQRIVERARAASVPVIWVQHEDEDLVHGSADWQWLPPLAPADGEARIYKRHNSAFEATDLEQRLAALGATHIVLAGAASNWCIRATAYAALERGYDLTLVGDAHTSGDLRLEDGTVLLASQAVADLNLVLRWLTYARSTTAVAQAETLDFTRPPRRLTA